MPTPEFLTLYDLYSKVGQRQVDQYFDDNVDGDVADTDEVQAINDVLCMAEGEAYARMKRAYASSDTITELANADPVFKSHVAWIALELASERRPSFMNEDGWGHYRQQYERAIKYLESLSKGRLRAKGEEDVGTTGQVGGTVQPELSSSTTPRFTFAPDKNSPSGHGGF
jgi:hypothetical protein